MVREYRWRLRVRSYEIDAWGFVPPSGVLRYLEQSAISAAADIGYDLAFHEEHNSTWVIRRMALQMHSLARAGNELEIATWLSHVARIRGGREYRIFSASTGEPVASALAEWVYLDRTTMRPKVMPTHIGAEFDVPGAPLGTYDAPPVEAWPQPRVFRVERKAEWRECDSLEHVNNSVYADWLDEAVRDSLAEMGLPVGDLKAQGLHLRGQHYRLEYKRAALPEERLSLETRLTGAGAGLLSVEQAIAHPGGPEVLTASTVYRWLNSDGSPAEGPELTAGA